MKKYLLTAIIFTGIASFISCGENGNKPAYTTEEKPPAEIENALHASLTEEQMKSIGIELGGIEEKQLTASLKTNGLLKVPNQNKAGVNSVYSGIIKSLLVQPGNIVSRGQIIATIANPGFMQVQEEYLSINSKIIMAGQEYDRQKELNAGNAGALKNLQTAESEQRTLNNRKSSLQQQIRLMGIKPALLTNGKLVSVLAIHSPISGVVSNVLVKIGSYVDVSTTVAEIVDNSQLHLDLFVYEKDLHQLKNNQLIHFTLTNNPGKEYDAQIFSLGSSFEGESKAVSVHAKVLGDKTGLIDGMNITAVISLEKAIVPAVPTEAIVTLAGQDYIFMLTGEQPAQEHPGNDKDTAIDNTEVKPTNKTGHSFTFKKVPVAKGTTDVGYTEITLLNAIPTDAKIVIKGAFFVLAKMTNSGE